MFANCALSLTADLFADARAQSGKLARCLRLGGRPELRKRQAWPAGCLLPYASLERPVVGMRATLSHLE